MPKKKFNEAPRPNKENVLSEAVVAAYEKNGIGSDNKQQNCKALNADIKRIRINVDLPSEEHRRFKTACSANSTTMVAELKSYIRKRVIELESTI